MKSLKERFGRKKTVTSVPTKIVYRHYLKIHKKDDRFHEFWIDRDSKSDQWAYYQDFYKWLMHYKSEWFTLRSIEVDIIINRNDIKFVEALVKTVEVPE